MNSLALATPRHPVAFPQTYLEARNALARCELVDECKDFADKAAAIEVYARQSKDDSLVIMAQRIQARAIRRMGELLAEIPERRGKNIESVRAQTRTAKAVEAGLSVHQRVTAARVSSIPSETFEQLIESQTPPRITALSRIGKKPRANTKKPPSYSKRVHRNCPTCTCCEEDA
ncbi:MAG TPA: hypothetical protein VNU21_01060 [Usitatibacter sp.]|nr:hypothetical protein [Usitatibacter sp.]